MSLVGINKIIKYFLHFIFYMHLLFCDLLNYNETVYFLHYVEKLKIFNYVIHFLDNLSKSNSIIN